MAGSATFNLDKLGINAMVLNIAWVGDASAGTVPATAVPAQIAKTIKGLSVVLATVNPSSPAPTDGFKITITDSDGIDVLGGALDGLSSTVSYQATPILVGSGVKRVTDGTLTFNIADTAVASSVGTCKLYFTN